MKRNLVLFLLAAVLCVSVALVACTQDAFEIKLDSATITLEKGESVELPYQLSKNGAVDKETNIKVAVEGTSVTYADGKITAVKAGRSILTLTVEGHEDVSAKLTVNVPEYTIEITGAGATASVVDLGGEENLTYTVKKDGLKVDGVQVNVSVTGDALKYVATGRRIQFVAVGEGQVKVSLKNDESVFAVKNYKVEKSFWSSEHAVNKELMTITNDSVSIPGGGGQQYYLGVMDGGTKYVFKASLKLPALTTSHSVGISNSIDKNDSSLWFGVQGTPNGKYKIYIKDYYATWAHGIWEGQPAGYKVGGNALEIEFDSETVDFIVVRDGQNYWYSIGGYIGTYAATDSRDIAADRESWVGIYSQEQKLSATNISYSTDEAEIAVAKGICGSEVAKLAITNADVTTVTKGTTFTYVAKAIGPNATLPQIEWTLDKSGMTAGADGTSIANGALTLADDAAGVVVVKASCGGKEATVQVNISAESLADENEQLSVNGGVVINEDGSVTFPEAFSGVNDSLNVSQYVDVFYSAKLKDKVQGDFELAFTIKNLKSALSPRVLVSLGAKNAQLFFSNSGVSVRTKYVDSSTNRTQDGEVTGTFAEAEELNVVVKVVGGHLKVVVNNTEVALSGDALRDIDSYMSEQPVLFTIGKGTSCVISDIEITDKDETEFIVLNSNTVLTENGFTSVMIPSEGNKWIGKDYDVSRTYLAQMLPEGNWTLSMDVKYSANQRDAKFAIHIGNWEFHVNNKINDSGVIEGEIYAGNWVGAKGNSTVKNATEFFNVTLKKINNTIYFYVNDKLLVSRDGMPADRIVSFWTLDDDTAAENKTVTAENITLKQGAVIISISGDASLMAGSSATYTSAVLGSDETPAWSVVTDTTLTAGTASITEQGVLTFSPDAKGSVTVIVAYGEETLSMVVSVSDQPANQDTAIAESVGGVKQDVDNGKIIFDNADINGVADQQKWALSEYYAILNDENKDRITIQDNFVIEFTVSNYKTTAQHPKLMVSLGNRNEQFYIVYFPNGTAQIQTYTNPLKSDGTGDYNGQWINSAFFANDFNVSTAHTYKFICEDGYYKVLVDNVEVTGWNMDGDSRTLFRSPESMAIERNIMLSTNDGTTCEVSNISVMAVAGKEGKVTTHFADYFSVNEETGDIVVTMSQTTTRENNAYIQAQRLYSYGEKIENDSIVTFDVKFDGNFTDQSLTIKFGTDRALGIALNGDNIKGEYHWDFVGQSVSKDSVLVDGVLKVKITIAANGDITAAQFVDANGKVLATVNASGINATNNGVMSFSSFNWNNQNTEGTITISNIVITPATQQPSPEQGA